MEEYINEYLMDLQNRNLSKNTLEAYKSDMLKFAQYLDKYNLRSSDITVEALNKYIDYLKKEKNKKATIDRMSCILRSYYKYLKMNNIIEENIALEIKKVKPRKEKSKNQEIPVLTKKQIYKFLDSPDTKTIKGKRDKAILELCYATGIKASEVIKLKLSDINVEKANVICGSKNNLRTIPIR